MRGDCGAKISRNAAVPRVGRSAPDMPDGIMKEDVRMMRQKQILVVEDNLINREMLKEILAEQYAVLEAGNGLEALEILEQHRDDIALILLDIVMPVMDGIAFLEQLKADAELGLIPVIVMTQSDSREDEIAALAHGATDFVPKPYRPQVILHRVASIIKLRETAAMVNLLQYDRLTGLYTKEFFYRKVRERLDEHPDQEYSLICSNIENFKLYNDVFGMEAGDRLLQSVSRLMHADTDEDAIYGRYIADRFICLQKRARAREFEQWAAAHMHEWQSEDMKNITVKFGVYEITDRSVSVEQMCDRASLAASSIGGNYNQSIAVYDDVMRSKLLQEKAITDVMETALAERQFFLNLQPKYSLADNRMVGAEALVRWIHPEWGFMSPGQFIPLFEKNGFISKLDRYIWEEACALLRRWQDQGLPVLPVSVNVSRIDIYQSHLEETLLGLVQKYGIDPALLHLEITESAYTENTGRVLRTMEELKKLGFVIEMDDFGSGYSSLSLLGQMKLDILKLDMKFVQNETEKPEGQSILNDIVNMAHRLHLKVVAEGVETRAQMRRLQQDGCDYVQGYFFSKPVSVAEYEDMLRKAGGAEPQMQADARQGSMLPGLLVIDDDAAYREGVRWTFEDQYEVLEACDMKSACECLAAHRGGVSAIVLSMLLPENGAVEFLRKMRSDSANWNIPVLALIPQCDVEREFPQVLELDDFLCKCHPMFDLRRRVVRLIDVESVYVRARALQDAANQDYLTKLNNRRGLQNAMNALREEDLPAALYLFDLDNLKHVNDSCGHDTGDRMIEAFAKLLRQMTRGEDVLCRYGGDEFIVILKHMSDAETAVRKGDRICQAFRESLVDESVAASCSCGVSLCGKEGDSAIEWIERADRALYRAKRENKGGCCVWSSEAD